MSADIESSDFVQILYKTSPNLHESERIGMNNEV